MIWVQTVYKGYQQTTKDVFRIPFPPVLQGLSQRPHVFWSELQLGPLLYRSLYCLSKPENIHLLLDFSLTVKAACHECLIRTWVP